MDGSEEPAPYFGDVAEGPEGGRAVWIPASDGLRLRAGFWPRDGALGTVLIFPGRTEYIEKYGRVATDLGAAGYAVAAMDWRGQGASDRVHDDPFIGHVDQFRDYQKDVAAFIEAARLHKLPEPFFLIAHSMGGCIGLRALIEGLPVKRAVFSGPMWGIHVTLRLKPVAAILPSLARSIGRDMGYVPGSRPNAYVTEVDHETNLLTTDRDHFDYLTRQAAADPRFALGGPSLRWFYEAIREAKTLEALPKPSVPVRIFVGTDEEIVSKSAIERVVAKWPSAQLDYIEGGKHELMMEAPPLRQTFMDQTIAFFKKAS